MIHSIFNAFDKGPQYKLKERLKKKKKANVATEIKGLGSPLCTLPCSNPEYNAMPVKVSHIKFNILCILIGI